MVENQLNYDFGQAANLFDTLEVQNLTFKTWTVLQKEQL